MYIEHLIGCKRKLGFQIYDIVCMSNHVHELYRVPKEVNIAQILQRVKGQFSKKFNERYKRSYHFWKSRSFYRIVENEIYAFNTMNYFHWNPVKAGMVRKPEEWPYSGYRFHILHERNGPLSKLLDPLPDSAQKIDLNIIRTVEKIFNSQSIRYIGNVKFRQQMRQRT